MKPSVMGAEQVKPKNVKVRQGKPDVSGITEVKSRVSIMGGIMEYARHLFSEILLFGDNDVFGWTVSSSDLNMGINNIKPKIVSIQEE